MSGANLRGSRRAVKPAERALYDACHAAMRADLIYAWNISKRDGSWSVQSGPQVFVLEGATMAEVRAYLVSVGADVPAETPRKLSTSGKAATAERATVDKLRAYGLTVGHFPGTRKPVRVTAPGMSLDMTRGEAECFLSGFVTGRAASVAVAA